MSQNKPPANVAFGFILVTAVLDTLAFGLMMPVLPKLLMTLEGGDTVRAATFLGIFSTVWAIMQFIASPVLGALSDRFGRRPVLLISIFGLGLNLSPSAVLTAVINQNDLETIANSLRYP